MANLARTVHLDELVRSTPFVASLGLVSHFVLSRGEWDASGHVVLATWIIAFGTVAVAEYAIDPRVQSPLQALWITSTTAAIYFASLSTSILIYRAFFHRLRKFPGPFFSRLTKWNSVRISHPQFQYYNVVEQLHKKYNADIVRTGPRELSIISADAIPLIQGPMTKCRKGPWYLGPHAVEKPSLQTTRSKAEHKERRKVWDRAFNAKSLRDYEPRVNRHSHVLLEKLKERASQPSLRISDWFNFFSFDIMGDVGFSRSFEMVENGKEDDLITTLHKSMAGFSIMSHVSWLLSMLLRTAAGAKDMRDHMEWTAKVLKERKKIIPPENDVFSWLLDPDDEEVPGELNSDARLLVVAGSDTTSATLTWLAWELCKNPAKQTKLAEAISKIQPEKSLLDAEDVADCPYLDGVIHEALRLHPAVPSGVQRETPPEGIILPDQTYIPGETVIWIPPHTIQRDARYFPEPLKFLPERWTEESPELVADKRAFVVFGGGAYSCIGQKLSIMEMRVVVSNLVRNFEVHFAKDEDGSSLLKDTVDCFTLNIGKLDVKLTPRS